jgi:hypothetical protein
VGILAAFDAASNGSATRGANARPKRCTAPS